MSVVSVLKKAALHRADEKGFGQHYSYEIMNIKFFEAKQQTTINAHTFFS
jgi:hypothetical protein